jgi:Protein of unknown function (DUF3024)
MALTDIEHHKIKKFIGGLCEDRTPEHLKDQLRYEYEIYKQSVVVFEVRPVVRVRSDTHPLNDPSEYTQAPIAKIKFIRSSNTWRLYWQRADMKWHSYEPLDSSKDLKDLIDEIERDPNGCFFG